MSFVPVAPRTPRWPVSAPPRGPGLVERFSAWIALQADRFADRLEDWADGLGARQEPAAAPGGPYRSRVRAPAEHEPPEPPRRPHPVWPAPPSPPRRAGSIASLRERTPPVPPPPDLHAFWADVGAAVGDEFGAREPHRAPPTIDDQAGPFGLGEIARMDPRLAVALLGGVAPPAGTCGNCGAPSRSLDNAGRCWNCGTRRRPTPGAGRSRLG